MANDTEKPWFNRLGAGILPAHAELSQKANAAVAAAESALYEQKGEVTLARGLSDDTTETKIDS